MSRPTHLWPDSEERTRATVGKAYAHQSADVSRRSTKRRSRSPAR
ncbi:hypothetical protein [Streptomyces lasalocidi]|nr:hypothetical protein [Streptomyces lasalocidi]